MTPHEAMQKPVDTSVWLILAGALALFPALHAAQSGVYWKPLVIVMRLAVEAALALGLSA